MGTGENQQAGLAEPAADAEVFDAELFQVRMGDPGMMVSLIEIFEEDVETMLTGIGVSLRQGDQEGTHRATHSLRGLVGNYCAKVALASAVELDNCAKSGDLEGVRELLPGVESEVSRLRGALETLRGTLS